MRFSKESMFKVGKRIGLRIKSGGKSTVKVEGTEKESGREHAAGGVGGNRDRGGSWSQPREAFQRKKVSSDVKGKMRTDMARICLARCGRRIPRLPL